MCYFKAWHDAETIALLEICQGIKLIAVVYTGFSAWGGVPAAIVPFGGGTFFIGESKNFAILQTRKFSKNAKKSMKIL